MHDRLHARTGLGVRNIRDGWNPVAAFKDIKIEKSELHINLPVQKEQLSNYHCGTEGDESVIHSHEILKDFFEEVSPVH